MNKLSTTALIFKDNLILGVSRKDNHNDFGLPGGKVDDGESVIEALHREILEETGLSIIKYKEIFSDLDKSGYYNTTYLCEVEGNILTEEKGRVAWITWEDLFNGCFGEYNKKLYWNYINDL
jgi:8-oxo-dGTP pyrophosphatase MutT (NUDIX family)